MKVTVICLTLACALLCGASSYGLGFATPTPIRVPWTPPPTLKITPIPTLVITPPPKITVRPIPTVVMPCPVSITEVMVNSTDNGEHHGEYIELYNNSMFDIDISDWIVQDRDGAGRITDFTTVSDLGVRGTLIPPFGYALIVAPLYNGMYNAAIRNDEEVDLNELIMVTVRNSDGTTEIGNGLGNGGDEIWITTDYENENGGSVVLHCAWGNQGQDGRSYTLCGNGWFTRDATPGGPNACGI